MRVPVGWPHRSQIRTGRRSFALSLTPRLAASILPICPACYSPSVQHQRREAGVVLYTGRRTLSFGDRLAAVPLCGLWS